MYQRLHNQYTLYTARCCAERANTQDNNIVILTLCVNTVVSDALDMYSMLCRYKCSSISLDSHLEPAIFNQIHPYPNKNKLTYTNSDNHFTLLYR